MEPDRALDVMAYSVDYSMHSYEESLLCSFIGKYMDTSYEIPSISEMTAEETGFLSSGEEDTARVCRCSDYAFAQGAYAAGRDDLRCLYWIRGEEEDTNIYMGNFAGEISRVPISGKVADIAIRPSICVEKENLGEFLKAGQVSGDGEAQEEGDSRRILSPFVQYYGDGSGSGKKKKVTYDCVWMGNYPQKEIIPSQFPDLSRRLQQKEDWDAHNCTWEGERLYYRWQDQGAYRYFCCQPVKWRVLEADQAGMLLISDSALDVRAYHDSNQKTEWKDTGLFQWLNSAFDDILNVQEGIGENTDGSRISLADQDLLTETGYGFEADFLAKDTARQRQGSEYAVAKGLWCSQAEDAKQCCWWWVKDGEVSGQSTVILQDGMGNAAAEPVTSSVNGIVPVIRVNMENMEGILWDTKEHTPKMCLKNPCYAGTVDTANAVYEVNADQLATDILDTAAGTDPDPASGITAPSETMSVPLPELKTPSENVENTILETWIQDLVTASPAPGEESDIICRGTCCPDGHIRLSWKGYKAKDGEKDQGIWIYRKYRKEKKYSLHMQVSVTDRKYDDHEVAPGRTYDYRIVFPNGTPAAEIRIMVKKNPPVPVVHIRRKERVLYFYMDISAQIQGVGMEQKKRGKKYRTCRLSRYSDEWVLKGREKRIPLKVKHARGIYQFRVRTYRVIKGKKYYSRWTSPMRVRI